MIENDKPASKVLAAQLPAIRARRQLTAEGLALRVRELGGGLDRAAISKIETGARGVSLDEAFMLAMALGVAPVHLFVPLDDAETMRPTAVFEASAADVRAWVRGQEPFPGQDDRAYRTEVPASEWAQRSKRLQDAEAAVERADRRYQVAEARLDRLSDEASASDNTVSMYLSGVSKHDRHVDIAYERIAEAKVDLDDARQELSRVLAEEGTDDGQR